MPDQGLGVRQRHEPVIVPAFVPEAVIERLDVGVLLGLARLDQEQVIAARMRPGEHRPASELLAVVRADGLRLAAGQRRLVQDAGQSMTADGALGLVRSIMHHGQALHDPAVRGRVDHEVVVPDFHCSSTPVSGPAASIFRVRHA